PGVQARLLLSVFNLNSVFIGEVLCANNSFLHRLARSPLPGPLSRLSPHRYRRRFRSSPGLVSISAGRSVTLGVKTMFLGPEPTPVPLMWLAGPSARVRKGSSA